MNELIFITKTTPAEQWYFNHINPFNPLTKEKSRPDSQIEIESVINWLDWVIAEVTKKLTTNQRYFQTLIARNPYLDLYKSDIKQRFKDRGILLSWKISRNQFILFIKLN